MRYLCALCVAAALPAQDASRQSTVYTYDVNGRRVAVSSSGASASSGSSYRAETTQSVNGRSVPLESVEEKVISEGPEGRVVERTVRRWDASGRSGQSEKVRIEERTDSSGAKLVSTTVYDSDLNGRFALREKSTARTTQSGDIVRTETVVERPTLNGGLDAIEKREATQTGPAANQLLDVLVYRRGTNGSLTQAERLTTQTVVEGNETTQTSATYNTGSTGKLELAGQRVSRKQVQSGGAETEVVDVYGGNPPAHTVSGYSKELALRERQIIERRPSGNQGLVETFSIRRPDLQSGALGPVTKVSETVCTGKCLP